MKTKLSHIEQFESKSKPVSLYSIITTKRINNTFWIFFLILVTIQAIFYIQPYRVYVISGMSMSSTLLPKDIVIAKKVSQNLHKCNKYLFEFGDLVIVKKPEKANLDQTIILKRIIGLPGDTVIIYKDFARINHQYKQIIFPETIRLIKNKSLLYDEKNSSTTILANELFLCGDNWYNSLDSRTFGKIPFSEVCGVVILSFRNFKKIST